MDKKRVLVDFDGTINSYRTPFDHERPWHLPDPPVPGAIAWLRRVFASGVYEPVIFTTRVYSAEVDGDDVRVASEIRDWLGRHGLERVVADQMVVTSRKLPCALIVDDNAFRFEGVYPTPHQMAELTATKRRRA
jgi:hypothetical protein